MIWHPLAWAFWAAAATGGVLYMQLVPFRPWTCFELEPGTCGYRSAAAGTPRGTAALLGHWALGCLAAAAVLGLVGICPGLASDGSRCHVRYRRPAGHGNRRQPGHDLLGLTLVVLYGWRTLDRLDSHHPEGHLIQTGARLMIGAAPFFVLAVFFSWQALMRIENVPPVSCCAAVYDPDTGRGTRNPLP
jgi:hypothetical protein